MTEIGTHGPQTSESRDPGSSTAQPWWRDNAERASSHQESAPVITIAQFLRILRRRWLVVVGAVVVTCLLAAGLLALAPKTYQAVAVIDLSPALTSTSSNAATISTTTEARIVTSVSVARLAVETLASSRSPQDLAQSVDVSSPLSSEVLDVTFTAPSARGAADGANAFARAYLTYRSDTIAANQKLRESKVTDQITSLQDQLAKLETQTSSRAAAQRSQAQGQLNSLQGQLNGLRTTVTPTGVLAGPASAPTSAASPRPLLFGAAGLVGGLLIGIGLALVRHKVDGRVTTSTELGDTLGVPVLADVPQSTPARGETGSHLEELLRSRGREADAYRTVAAMVGPEDGDGTLPSVLLLGVGLPKAFNPVPLNLAATFAAQGLRTVLAATNRAADGAERLLAIDVAPVPHDAPFVEQLSGPGDLPMLTVLPLGDEVFLGATLRANGGGFAALREQADVVVVDGVNLALGSSTLALGRVTDAAVVVAGAKRTRRTDLEHAVDQLAKAGATVVGALLLTRGSRRDRVSAQRDDHKAQKTPKAAKTPKAPKGPKGPPAKDHRSTVGARPGAAQRP